MPFKIDLHTHSFFSGDGVSSPEENIAAAKAKGLDGFAITDHNTNDGVTYLLEKGLMREDGMPVDNFLIIPGVEVTTAEGHLLSIGASLPLGLTLTYCTTIVPPICEALPRWIWGLAAGAARSWKP